MEDEVDRHIAASAARLSAIVTPNAKLVIWSVEPETYFGLLPDGLLCQIHEHLDSSQLIPSISLSENQWAAYASDDQ